MYSVNFMKKNEQSETTLRNSAVRYSLFCGSLFDHAESHMSGQWQLVNRINCNEQHKTDNNQ